MTDDSKLKKPTRKDRIKKRHHNIHTVSPGMVHGILSGKYHKPPESDDKISIYDLINSDLSEEELENLDPKKVRYD